MRPYRVIAASAFALLVLSGCGDPAEGQAPPAAAPVSVAVPLARQVTDWDEFVGRFEAVQTVDVRARVGGYVQAVHFRDGQQVRRGQLLFTLDPRPAQAALAAARASVSQAEAQLNLARANFARAEGLLEAQAVSQAEFDSTRAAVSQAEAAAHVATEGHTHQCAQHHARADLRVLAAQPVDEGAVEAFIG